MPDTYGYAATWLHVDGMGFIQATSCSQAQYRTEVKLLSEDLVGNVTWLILAG